MTPVLTVPSCPVTFCTRRTLEPLCYKHMSCLPKPMRLKISENFRLQKAGEVHELEAWMVRALGVLNGAAVKPLICPKCIQRCHQDRTSFWCDDCRQLWPKGKGWEVYDSHVPVTNGDRGI